MRIAKIAISRFVLIVPDKRNEKLMVIPIIAAKLVEQPKTTPMPPSNSPQGTRKLYNPTLGRANVSTKLPHQPRTTGFSPAALATAPFKYPEASNPPVTLPHPDVTHFHPNTSLT